MSMNRMSQAILQALLMTVSLSVTTARAQDVKTQGVLPAESRADLEQAVERLQEALGLNVRSGLFSARAGEISASYLARQGLLLELSTPLGTRRGLINLDTVNASLQSLSNQLAQMNSPQLPAITAPDIEAMRETMALSLRRDQAAEYYRDMINKVAEVDLSAEIEQAMQAISARADALRGTDNPAAPELAAEAQRLRQQLQEQLLEQRAQLEALTAQLRQRSAESTVVPPQSLQEQWQQQLAALAAAMEPLRQAATTKANELNEQLEAWRQRRMEQWQQELQAFEARLFARVCEEPVLAALIPAQQHLTLVLPGLGEETAAGERRDRIHVLAAGDLQACASGQIDAQTLLSLATSYSD
ncbi:MAG: hypothetical protein RQ757_00405 [Pseudomonadales bacterium]|nr:hypothetical protein [Pseudomonadales bacterium]